MHKNALQSLQIFHNHPYLDRLLLPILMPATAAALKLGMAAASRSISVHTWARAHTSTRNFTATGTTLPSPQSSSSLPSFPLALYSNTQWRGLASRARVASLSNFHHCNFSNHAATNNDNLSNDVINIKKKAFLGFPFRAFPFFPHPSSSSSPRIFSSSTRSGSDLSPPSGSHIESGMESENKLVDDVDWFRDDSLKISQIQQPLSSPSPNDHRCHQHNKLLTLPTVLTLGRVAAVPLLVATFYVDCWWGRTATTSIFVVAAITDWLDGYLARKMRLGTAFGAFLDPVADKLMVAATLILLCSEPLEVGIFEQVPWLMTVPTIAIIGREITMSAVREWAASQSTKLLEAVAVNNLGKWKTATQMTALTILLAARDSSLGGPEFLVISGIVFLYISAGLSVWSLGVYVSKIWKVLLK